MEAVFEVCLPHAALTVRVAAAALLRQLATALPGQRVPLMDRCLGTLTAAVSQSPISAEAVSGYSLALGGLLASVGLGDLGIPSAKGKAVSGTSFFFITIERIGRPIACNAERWCDSPGIEKLN